MSEWQPIVTAPRDGTQIILAQFIGKDEPYIIGGWYEPGIADRCWYDFDSQSIGPTHWMPIPPDPRNRANCGTAQNSLTAGAKDE